MNSKIKLIDEYIKKVKNVQMQMQKNYQKK